MMLKKIVFSLLLFVGVQHFSWSQDGFSTFKIANLQSTQVAEGGKFYLYVTHRFGSVSDGFSTFFGMDNSNTKIQAIYGLMDGIQIGLSRESLRKTFAGSAKFRLMSQGEKWPLNMSLYTTINLNSQLSKEEYPKMLFYDRLSYTTQLLVSKTFNDRFSLELAPSYVRQNLVWEPFQKHNQFAVGIGGSIKLTDALSLTTDYVYNFSRAEASVYNDPLSVGLDIKTGAHVFQIIVSNAQSANEPGFITNGQGSWLEGDVFLGLNLMRRF